MAWQNLTVGATVLTDSNQKSIAPETKSFRVGIIGVGYGRRVHKPASELTGRATVVAACGRDSSSAGSFQTSGFESVDSWQAICDSDKIDVVVVASPASSHQNVLRYLSPTDKAVIIEKPAGLDLEAAENIERLLRRQNTIHAIGFQFRFEPAILALRDVISSGDLGRIERIDVRWLVGGSNARNRAWRWQDSREHGGGILLNFATHVIDYVSMLCGPPKQRHSLTYSNVVTERPLSTNKSLLLPVDAEDSATVQWSTTLNTECCLVVSNSSSANLGHSLLISGSKGCASLEWKPPFMPENTKLEILCGNGSKEIPLPQPEQKYQGFDSRLIPTLAFWNAFLDNITNENKHNLPTIEDAIIAHRLIASNHK